MRNIVTVLISCNSYMSLSPAEASLQEIKFYYDVAKGKKLWLIRDDGGFPAPLTNNGQRVMPFWSRLAMAKKIIQTVPAYNGFTPHELSLDEFISKWVSGLKSDGLLMGLNWSGPTATGYDRDPEEVQKNIESTIEKWSASG